MSILYTMYLMRKGKKIKRMEILVTIIRMVLGITVHVVMSVILLIFIQLSIFIWRWPTGSLALCIRMTASL